MNNVAAIIKFLNAHDVGFGSATVLSSTEDTITVRCVEYKRSGESREVKETIPATIKAARDWLGY